MNGEAGAFIEEPGERHELRAPAGRLSSSFRAELFAISASLRLLCELLTCVDDPIVICTDSLSVLASLRASPAEQVIPLGVQIWEALSTIARGNRQVILQ